MAECRCHTPKVIGPLLSRALELRAEGKGWRTIAKLLSESAQIYISHLAVRRALLHTRNT